MGRKLRKLNESRFQQGLVSDQIINDFVVEEWNNLRESELSQFQQLWGQTYGKILSGKGPVTLTNQQCVNQQGKLLDTVDELRNWQPLYEEYRVNMENQPQPENLYTKQKLNQRKKLYKLAFDADEINHLKQKTFFSQIEKSLDVERKFNQALGKESDRLM